MFHLVWFGPVQSQTGSLPSGYGGFRFSSMLVQVWDRFVTGYEPVHNGSFTARKYKSIYTVAERRENVLVALSILERISQDPPQSSCRTHELVNINWSLRVPECVQHDGDVVRIFENGILEAIVVNNT